jgi:aminoglycoside/choline kinase family phosphotransferase
MLPIPLAPSDVTPAWLTAALRESGIEGVEVKAVTDSHVQSLTSTMHRLHIEYARADAAYPATLIWKQSSTDSTIRAAFGHFIGSGYEREVRFYREVAPRIETRVPRCYIAQYDEATDEHVLLLDDLGPTHHAGDLLEGMRVSDAAAALYEVALLHCVEWSDPPPPDPAARERTRNFFGECLAECRGFLEEVAGSDTLRALDPFVDAFVSLLERSHAGPQALLHSDLHPGNMMFPTGVGDRVALVDWQGWRTGPAMRDVGRCLVLMLSVEERHRAERQLVAGYCAVLRAHGIEYRRGAGVRGLPHQRRLPVGVGGDVRAPSRGLGRRDA